MTVKNIGISCTTRRQHKYPLVESEALTGHERIAGTGYIQAWPQEKLSSVSFSVRPAHLWDMETSTYADELTLNCIKSLGAIETDYDNLRDTIINAIRRETQ